MKKIENFKTVIDLLYSGFILTSDGNNMFYYNDDKVIYNFNGNNISININEFIDLFKEITFFVKEKKEKIVDEDKDYEYYSKLQRKN